MAVPAWFSNLVSNDGFQLVAGAVLATLGGYAATLIQEARHRRAVRRGLGAILHGELVTMSPSKDPIYWDPDNARRLVIRSIPQLLTPGVLDPARDTAFLMELIHFARVVDEYNERAAL